MTFAEMNKLGHELGCKVLTHIDDKGHIKGTWGSLRLLPEDSYEVVEEAP